MSAALKTQQMDWSKYTIDGWLEQFGAWCETVRMNDNILGDPIKIYVNSRDSKNTTLPKYLIEFSPIGDEVEYLGTRNLPSLIELLNKLTPLVTATTVCDYINDKYAK
ncbi:TPA: hypothetical protein ACHKB2_001748 [Acinetobacter baumannii]|uniref:hypothetical protein n=1 Tax=Acinetobacter baumannii TaxID=470 RepID=UPI00101EC2E7|nr:hypothetical protein [Acinetobacter baumannii]MDC4326220.1 hypothetical protein [Acinetobacter baumannii]MDC4391856.1 hypothetical protein [Acinetobacter baumannii]RYL19454.1 hypothetical protein EWO92_00140 [Acinetobacter baumannii]RYL32843.1 hypothetical protein EWO96_03675 [Acinetobacter baumannii]RYL45963.1 hypothetical protein EWP49_03675 [Acinetobacter baumannii]